MSQVSINENLLTQITPAVEKFIDWVENSHPDDDSEIDAKSGLQCLAELYSGMMHLMVNDLEDADSKDVDNWEVEPNLWHRAYDRFDNLPLSIFSEMEVPSDNQSEIVRCDIKEELADIYEDILEGLNMHRVGHGEAALWHWKLKFEFHWGSRVLSVMTALHSFFQENSDWEVFEED